jgi:ABC-type Fe3+-siderophore transport system permease subunit
VLLGYLYVHTNTRIQNVVVVVLVLLKLAIWQFIMQFFFSNNLKLPHFSRINTCTKSVNFISWGCNPTRY